MARATPKPKSMRLSPSAIESQARYFMKQERYEEAIRALEDEPHSPIQIMILAECFFYTKNWFRLIRCIDEMPSVLPKYCPRLSPLRLVKVLERDIDESQFICAMVLVPAVAKAVLAKVSDARKASEGIKGCVYLCYKIIGALSDRNDLMRKLAIKIAVEYMPEIADLLRYVNGSDPYVKECEIWCMTYLGRAYENLEDEWNSEKYFRMATKLMGNRTLSGASSSAESDNLLQIMGRSLQTVTDGS